MSCFLVNWLSARATLGVMAFFMFLVTQMIRVSLYVSVIAFDESINGTGQHLNVSTKENSYSLLLGAFYWSYWATELPGGFLAQLYGGKKVLGLGVTLAGVVNLLLPVACKYHYLVASFLRAVQGLALVRHMFVRSHRNFWRYFVSAVGLPSLSFLFFPLLTNAPAGWIPGVTWPVMHWLSARWVPRDERSKFMTSYHGAAIGSAITYPLSGLIITHFGWEYVFYVVSIITFIWCFAWWILVFDSPKKHPRLTDEESKYLAEAIGDTVATNESDKPKTPWRDIIYSKSFWAVFMASQGLMWGTITLSMQTPAYFYQVHHLNVKSSSLLSGIPEVSKFLFALLFSAVIDKMINKKVITVTAARKLAVAVSEYIPANFLILLGLYGASDTVLATVLLTFISLVGGGSSSGSLANIVDISPNHAGVLLGIIKTITVIPGVLSPVMVAHFTTTPMESEEVQWRNVFFLIAAIYIICSTIFLLFGSGEVQPWNQSKEKTKEELTFLKTKKTEKKCQNAEKHLHSEGH